ncbi:MAG: tRNA (adenosine(37)-N6)-threonylcarbamoyltransferase complex dimerization subunit type 1 TsaB [Pseudomonadota bacterium]
MNLLALDTSSVACSVALSAGDRVLARHETGARQHTSLLVPMIHAVSEEAGLALTELDAVVLGNGPGSFIGMRIAASVAQGIAFAARTPLAPVSSMAALAAAVFAAGDAEYVAVTQDAHMQEVYFGLYRRSDAELVSAVAPERIAVPGRVEELASLERCVAAGEGWAMYPELLAANEAVVFEETSPRHPNARDLLALGALAFAGGKVVSALDVEPAYLRQKVASVPARKNS